MIGFAVSFIGGIAAFNFFPFFPLSIIILCSAFSAFLFFKHREYKKKTILLILFFTFGILYSFIRHEAFNGIKFQDRDVYVEGTVIDVPEISGKTARLTLDSVLMEGENVQGRVRVFVFSEKFLDNSTQEYFMIAPGDRISAIAKLGEPNVFRNPGVYSYDLRKQGIVAAGYTLRMKVIGRDQGILSWIYRKRQMLGRIIDNSLTAENASLHRAIIPGLKRGISRDMRDGFSSTGLAHLLSISGTHFGLLAFIIFKFVRMIVKFLPVRLLIRMTLYITPTQIAVLITLPVLVFYALISGASTPTIRALIMIFIYMLALFLGRKGQWLNSLSIAAIIILLFQPNALFEISFQLSFIAVLFIGFFLEKRAEQEMEDRMQEAEFGITDTGYSFFLKSAFVKVKTALLITVAAVLGTAPIVAVYFKQFPLISPVTNLIVTPLVCFLILPLGFFTGLIALLFNMPSMPLNGLTDTITHFVLILIKGFSDIPYSNLHIPNPSFLIITLYFFSLIFIIKSRRKWRFLPLVFVVCFYAAGPYISPLSSDNLRITFLDVGQGDSSLVELPDKKVMLIDAGSDDIDAGSRIIAPYLWSRGIRKIDYMVLSHPHPDHYGGFIYIMDNFDVGEIWVNSRETREAAEFFKKMHSEKIPGKVLRRGDVLETGDYKIYVFHPYEEFFTGSPKGEYYNENNYSLVLKIDTGNASVLFTGDIENEAEEDVVHLGKWLTSDILKVPHHGGRTSSSEEFLKMVSPQTAVVSTGRNNPFNHPNEEAVERYKDAGIKLFRTDKHGAVTVILKDRTNKSYKIKTYADSKLKKVKTWRDEIRNLRLLL